MKIYYTGFTVVRISKFIELTMQKHVNKKLNNLYVIMTLQTNFEFRAKDLIHEN